MVNTFLSDKKEDIGSLLSVRCVFTKFSDYEIKILPELEVPIKGGRPFIEKDVEIVAGVLPVIKNENPTFIVHSKKVDIAHEVVFQKDVLFEVLALTKDVDMKGRFNEQAEQAIPTAGILALCKKYGINPNVGGPIWMKYGIPGFALRDFKYKLYSLRWRLAVYTAVYYEDYNLMRELVPLIDDMPTKKTNNEHILSAAKEWINMFTGKDINLSLRSVCDGFSLEVCANNIIDVCDVFLSLMIANGDCRNIKICPNCNRVFFGHGNKKYCDNCNRKTVWSRKNRKRKKEKTKRGS